jgi:hypothetical protein
MKYLYVGSYEHPGTDEFYRFIRYKYLDGKLHTLECSDTLTDWDTPHSVVGGVPWGMEDKYATIEDFLASPLTCTASSIPKFKQQYPELFI